MLNMVILLCMLVGNYVDMYWAEVAEIISLINLINLPLNIKHIPQWIGNITAPISAN